MKERKVKMKDYLIVNAVFDISKNGVFANTGKEYCFLSYEDVTTGDVVVVDTAYGFQLATVTGLASRIPSSIPKGKMKEVMCKVDFSAYTERKEKAEKMKHLKAEMDKRIKKLEEDAVYEMMAEKDSVLKEMLDEFKALQD